MTRSARCTSPGMTADAALAVAPPQGDDADFLQFLRVLVANGRLPLLPEIALLFEQARAEAEKVVKVKVTSAAAMGADEVASLSVALRRRSAVRSH